MIIASFMAQWNIVCTTFAKSVIKIPIHVYSNPPTKISSLGSDIFHSLHSNIVLANDVDMLDSDLPGPF